MNLVSMEKQDFQAFGFADLGKSGRQGGAAKYAEKSKCFLLPNFCWILPSANPSNDQEEKKFLDLPYNF